MAPLWKLCANGKVTEVKAALAKGVDVNGRNGGNETALMTTAGQVVSVPRWMPGGDLEAALGAAFDQGEPGGYGGVHSPPLRRL